MENELSIVLDVSWGILPRSGRTWVLDCGLAETAVIKQDVRELFFE